MYFYHTVMTVPYDVQVACLDKFCGIFPSFPDLLITHHKSSVWPCVNEAVMPMLLWWLCVAGCDV